MSSTSAALKTPSRRRRRKPDATTTTTTTEKENQSRQTAAREVLKSVVDDNDAENFVISLADKTKTSSSSSSTSSPPPAEDFATCLQQFEHDIAASSQPQLWKSKEAASSLAKAVLQASLNGKTQSPSLHLQETMTTAKVLSTCRKLIKDATEQPCSGKNDVKQQNSSDAQHQQWASNLIVALHGLRATAGAVKNNDTAQVEMALKLLYHLLTAVNDYCDKGVLEAAVSETTMTASKAASICVAAYEALGTLLSSYHYTLEKDGDGDGDDNNKGTMIQFEKKALFCIPTITETKGGKSNAGTMTFRQIATIAIKSTLVVGKVLNAAWIEKHMEKKSIPNHDNNWSSNSYYLGNFSRTVLGQVQSSTIRRPFSITMDLAETILQPWTTFILNNSNDKECIKDVPSHCKLSHKLLWDAAAILKAGPNLSYSNTEFQRYSIELRQLAVQVLLPIVSRSTPKTSKWIQAQLLESACTYAWKAAAVYCQQLKITSYPVSNDENALVNFHQDIGTHLASVVQRTDDGSNLTFGYFEYFAYRALHLGDASPSSAFLYDNEHQNSSHLNVDANIDVSNEGCLGRIVLSLFLLTLGAKQMLERIDVYDDDDLIDAQRIIKEFHSVVIEKFAKLSSSLRKRCYKLLSLIPLHRSVFQKLKGNATITQSEHCVGLEIAAVVLKGALGPFFEKLATSCDEQDANRSYYEETTVESYLRAACAYDALIGAKFSKSYSQERKDVIVKLVEISLSTGIVEKSAKSLALLSRQHLEESRYQQAIIPHLRSIQLFSSLVNNDDNERRRSLQLSVRWTHLSTAFQQEQRYDCACIASLAATLSWTGEIECSQPSKSFPELWRHLASRSCQVLGPLPAIDGGSDRRRSLVRKLIVVFEEYYRSNACIDDGKQEPPKTLSLSKMLQLLIKSTEKEESLCELIKEANKTRFCLGDLVRVAFLAKIFEDDQSQVEKVDLLFELLIQLGPLIQQKERAHTMADPLVEALLRDFQLILCTATDVLARLSCKNLTEASTKLLSVILHISSAAALTPFQNLFQQSFIEHQRRLPPPGCLKLSSKLCGKAETLLSKFDFDYVYDILAQTTRVSIEMMKTVLLALDDSNISNYTSMGHVSMMMQEVVSLGTTSTPQADNEMDLDLIVFECLQWSMSHLQSILELMGDHQGSSKVLKFMERLVKRSEKGDLTTLMVGSCSTLIATNIPNQEECDKYAAELGPVFDVLIQVNSLIEDGRSAIAELSNCIDNLITEVDVAVEHETKEVATLAMWAKSCILFWSSKVAKENGMFIDALQAIQDCFETCQSCQVLLHKSTLAEGASHFWANVNLSTLPTKLMARQLDCLQEKASIYCLMGDSKKSEAYASALLERLEFSDSQATKTGVTLEELFSCGTESVDNLRARAAFRLRVILKAMASSMDYVLPVLSPKQDSLRSEETAKSQDIARYVDAASQHLSYGDILYGDGIYLDAEGFQKHYVDAREIFEKVVQSEPFKHWGSRSAYVVRLKADMDLRWVREIMETPGTMSVETSSQVSTYCDGIISSSLSSETSKAWAHYYLGQLGLLKCRHNGFLESLWSGRSNVACCLSSRSSLSTTDEHSVAEAKDHFLRSLSLAGSVSEVLYRNAIRFLALLTGPDVEEQPISAVSASILILSSIGRQARHHKLHLDGSSPESFFSSFDIPLKNLEKREESIQNFFRDLHSRVPSDWKYVGIAIVPTGELLLTCLQSTEEYIASKTFCVFPDDDNPSAYESVVKAIDHIVETSQKSLSGVDEESVSKDYCTQSAKKEWWNQRSDLDQSLSTLIEDIEDNYFGHSELRDFLRLDEDDESELIGNLASRFEAAVDLTEKGATFQEDYSSDLESQKKTLSKLTVADLKARLSSLGLVESQYKRLRKADLIDLVVETEGSRKPSSLSAPAPSTSEFNPNAPEDNSCIFLILDENLHRFPFEGMPILSRRTVCRVPCLSFILSILESRTTSGVKVDSTNARFVLDPDNNLRATRGRLMPVLDMLGSQNNRSWVGTVGEKPTPEFLSESLTQEEGLLLYFGHGGGQAYLSRHRIETLRKEQNKGSIDTTKRHSIATAVLMGCSSGRLVSLNRKLLKSLEQVPLYYEPEGIALSYIHAGSPCVVGNLWDVTDHDIDRFSMALLDSFLGNPEASSKSLPRCVAEARSACKMPFIVGCAPVCYGVPVIAKR